MCFKFLKLLCWLLSYGTAKVVIIVIAVGFCQIGLYVRISTVCCRQVLRRFFGAVLGLWQIVPKVQGGTRISLLGVDQLKRPKCCHILNQ